MIVRARWIVTVVRICRGPASSGADVGGPAVVVGFARVAAIAIARVERRPAAAHRYRAGCPALRIGERCDGVGIARLHRGDSTPGRLEWIGHDQALDAPLRHPFAARRRRPGPRDRRARDADLSERVVRLSGQRPRCGALQHGACGPRLLAHLESDRGRAGGARRRARRRRRRHRHRERPGGAAPCHRHAPRRGAAHRGVAIALRRIAQPARLHAAAVRRDDHLRRSARPRRMARRDTSRDATAVRRDPRQSRARGARHPARIRARTRARPAAARRLHVHHALPHASVRARRRSRVPFRDQVPVGAWRGHRRRAGRRGHVRLGRGSRLAASSRRSPSRITASTT